MIEGGKEKNTETNTSDNSESKAFFMEKVYKELANVASKMNDLLFSDDESASKDNEQDAYSEQTDASDAKSNQDGRDYSDDIKEMFYKLFSGDLIDNIRNMSETKSDDSNESNIEKTDLVLEKIAKSIGTLEGIKALIEKHPEKAELWKSQLKALDTLNDPDAFPVEIRSAQAKLSILKGQLLETAVKDALVDAGFDVEAQQRIVEGESGGTRPDVIAKNNTDYPIEIFRITIQPEETLCVECKCGGSSYMTNQLNNHIPNQLSGQEGTKVLLTTSDIKDTLAGLANSVCEKYGARLVILDVSVSDVENAIKEVASE